MTTVAHEKHAEIYAVGQTVSALTSNGHGIRMPVEWHHMVKMIVDVLRASGWFDLSNDVTVENDGITLRWTRLELKGDAFVLDQTLLQKAKESASP